MPLRTFTRHLRRELTSSRLVSTLVNGLGEPKAVGIAWHGVTKESLAGVTNYSEKHVSAKQFAEQLKVILSRHRVVSVSEIVQSLSESKAPERSAVFLSFDDAYHGLYEYALEILVKHKVPAAVFVPTSFVEGRRLDTDVLDSAILHSPMDAFACPVCNGKKSLPLITTDDKLHACTQVRLAIRRNSKIEYDSQITSILQSLGFQDVADVPPLGPDEQALTWEQVREMERVGIEFGSHSHSHRSMTSLDYATDFAELRYSKTLIEAKTDRACTFFAYPYGKPDVDNSADSQRAVAEAGYKAAFLTGGGHVRAQSNIFALRRNCITARTTSTDLQSILSTAGHSLLHRDRY